MAERDKYSKNIFDTEAEDPEKEAELSAFIQVLLESAKVFQTRRQQKLERYRELLSKKEQGKLGADEEEFLELYKVLSSYGMVERLPKNMLHLDIRRTDIYWKAAQLKRQLKELEDLYKKHRLTEQEKDVYIETNMLFNEYIDQAFSKGE